MSKENKESWLKRIKIGEDYIKALTTDQGKNKGMSILKSKKKTGFLGFLMAGEVFKGLFNDLIEETNEMQYLLTYKWSQDYIEMFFGQVRSCFGHNNNPTSRQFVFAYKRLLTSS